MLLKFKQILRSTVQLNINSISGDHAEFSQGTFSSKIAQKPLDKSVLLGGFYGTHLVK